MHRCLDGLPPVAQTRAQVVEADDVNLPCRDRALPRQNLSEARRELRAVDGLAEGGEPGGYLMFRIPTGPAPMAGAHPGQPIPDGSPDRPTRHAQPPGAAPTPHSRRASRSMSPLSLIVRRM